MRNPPGFSDCRIDADNDAIVDCLDACVDADEDGVGNGTNGNSSCAAQTAVDSNDDDPETCADTGADTCDDSVSQTFDPTNDGADADEDGLCDAGHPDAAATHFFMTADRGDTGVELFRSDGTSSGAVLVKDLRGQQPEVPHCRRQHALLPGRRRHRRPRIMEERGHRSRGRSSQGHQPRLGGGSNPRYLTPASSTLCFVADDGAAGLGLARR